MQILQRILVLLLIMLVACQPEQKKEDPFSENIIVDDAKADFALFRNILEEGHPALTEYLSIERKNQLFDSLSKSINEKTDLRDFYFKLNYLVNEIGCSHTYVSWPDSISQGRTCS